MHFEQGRDYRRAVHYLGQAGQNAIRRNAPHEAIMLREAELYRLKGELVLQSKTSFHQGSIRSKASQNKSEDTDSQDEAEACFLKAIDIARQQTTKLFELRVTMVLCRLWHEQGKTAQARERLVSVYNWFTEGHTLLDLQNAKALLAELN